MPLTVDHVGAGLSVGPVATIYPDEPVQVGDVVLVCEYRRAYWRKILEPSELIYPPSVSLAGWTLLGDTPDIEDSAIILRGVESIEPDPGSMTTGDGSVSGVTLDAYIRSQIGHSLGDDQDVSDNCEQH